MGMMRSLQRSIARARLADAGYDRVNKRMGMTAGGKREHEMEDKMHGNSRSSARKRSWLSEMRKQNPPVWRRVTEGDLAKKAEEASKKASLRRLIAFEEKKMRKRQHRTVHAEPKPVA